MLARENTAQQCGSHVSKQLPSAIKHTWHLFWLARTRGSRQVPFLSATREHVRALRWAHLLGRGSHLQVLLEGPAGALLVGQLLLQGAHLGRPLRRLSLQLLPQRRCLRGAGL